MTTRRGYSKNACTNCALAKRKCEWVPNEGICSRCKSRDKFCILKNHKKRVRKSKKDMEQTFSFNPNYKFGESEG